MESLQGYFLLASPHLSDGNFFRSVVFMLRHDDEGALGLVLTRPTHPAALEDNDDADELLLQIVIGNVDAVLVLKRRARAEKNGQPKQREPDGADDNDGGRIDERAGGRSSPRLRHDRRGR